MSFKIVDVIKKTKGISGKHKRVLEAWASFANKDGTNIFCAKDAAAKRAGVSRDTVYRNTAELVSLGLLVESSSHVCKIANCNKGRTHFTGKWGHYTVAYNLNVPKIAELQNAERCLSGNSLKVGVAKCRKFNVAKSDTTLPIETATASSSLDPTQFDPSVTSVTVSKEGSEEVSSFAVAHDVVACGDENDDSDQKQDTNQDQPWGWKIASNHPHHWGLLNDGRRVTARLVYRTEDEAESQFIDWEVEDEGDDGRVLVKPKVHHTIRAVQANAYTQAEHGDSGVGVSNLWSERLGRRLNQKPEHDEWHDAEGYYRELFSVGPADTVPDAELMALAEVMIDMQIRYKWENNYDGNHPIRNFFDWNRKHKPEKLWFRCGSDVAKTWWSESAHSGRVQWEQHDETECKICTREFAKMCGR